MKKLVFMFVMCAAIAFTACTKNAEPQTAPIQNDSVTVVEGDSTVATEEVKADAKEEATKEEAVKEETPAAEAAPAEKVEK